MLLDILYGEFTIHALGFFIFWISNVLVQLVRLVQHSWFLMIYKLTFSIILSMCPMFLFYILLHPLNLVKSLHSFLSSPFWEGLFYLLLLVLYLWHITSKYYSLCSMSCERLALGFSFYHSDTIIQIHSFVDLLITHFYTIFCPRGFHAI